MKIMKNKDIIQCTFPAKAEYATSLRLLFAGLGSRAGFDLEQVEDLKVVAVEFLNMAVREEKDCLAMEVTLKGEEVEISSQLHFDQEDDLTLKIMESLCDQVQCEEGKVWVHFRKE